MAQRTAMVTGGTRGIGQAIVRGLLKEGYQVALTYAYDDEKAQAALEEYRALSPDVLLWKADVASFSAMRAFFQRCLDTFHTLDVLVNNASINIDKPLHQLTEDDWDRVVDTNMKGVFVCSQLAAASMLQQEQGGCILNLGSTTAIQGRVNGLNYCAAKAGVLVMTKCLALELAPKVRVNCLIPGFTWTDETEKRFRLDEEENVRRKENTIPLRAVGKPQDIAEVALFLLSDAARYITGQKVIVDGGQFMF